MRKFEELIDLINTKHPEWKNLTVRGLKDISGYSHDASRLALNVVKPNKNQTPKQTKNNKKSTPERESYSPTNTTGSIAEKLNDPVKFVQTIIVDELVSTRDVRWAQLFVSILDKTNKLDYESIRETEWLNQAKNMSMKELVEKVAKRESISRSTLRRLDDLGDTSQYESL